MNPRPAEAIQLGIKPTSQMKIEFYQMSKGERNILSDALRVKARNMEGGHCVSAHHYMDLANRIKHGEVLLGNYVYTEQEKGGENEAGHKIAE